MTSVAPTRHFTGHPVFRLFVILWFAALMGAGLFVLPAASLTALAETTGLAALHPIFAAPLGFAGRLALAIAAALIGLVIGWLIANRIAQRFAGEDGWDEEYYDDDDAQSDTAAFIDADGEADEPVAPRMFNPREELGEDGILDADYEDIEIDDIDEDTTRLLTADAHDEDYAEPAEIDFDGEDPDETPLPHFIEERDAGEDIGEPAAPIVAPALADLSLPDLTRRLETAIADRIARDAAADDASEHEFESEFAADTETGTEENDPVIAFLRREAGRSGAPQRDAAAAFATADSDDGDPQDDLRRALERLSRIGRPD